MRGQNDASEGAKAEQGDGQGGEAASDVDSPAKGSENQASGHLIIFKPFTSFLTDHVGFLFCLEVVIDFT